MNRTVRIKWIIYPIMLFARAVVKVLIPFTLILRGDSVFNTGSIMILSSHHIILSGEVAIKLATGLLFKPVNRSIVLIASLFRMVRTVINGINLLYRYVTVRSSADAEFPRLYEPGWFHCCYPPQFSYQSG